MTVTVAQYLTPDGTDIHKNGIEPDIKAAFSEQEIRDFKSKDLGTQRDSQYRIAEQTLLETMVESELSLEYKPGSSNLLAALNN